MWVLIVIIIIIIIIIIATFITYLQLGLYDTMDNELS